LYEIDNSAAGGVHVVVVDAALAIAAKK